MYYDLGVAADQVTVQSRWQLFVALRDYVADNGGDRQSLRVNFVGEGKEWLVAHVAGVARIDLLSSIGPTVTRVFPDAACKQGRHNGEGVWYALIVH
jgi:hypothetical protein